MNGFHLRKGRQISFEFEDKPETVMEAVFLSPCVVHSDFSESVFSE